MARRDVEVTCPGCGGKSTMKQPSYARKLRKGNLLCHACSVKSPEYKAKHVMGVHKAQSEGKYEALHEHNRQHARDPDRRAKASQNAKKLWSDTGKADVLRQKIRDRCSTEEWKEKLRNRSEEVKHRVKDGVTKAFQNEEVKARWKKSVTSQEYRNWHRTRTLERWEAMTDEQRLAHQATSIRTSKLPEVREKLAIVRQRMPTVSSLNMAVLQWFADRGIEAIPEYALGPYNFDAFIPSKNVLIEAHGEYWHGLPRAVRNDKSKATFVERYHPNLRLAVIWELYFHSEGRLDFILSKLMGAETGPTIAVDLKQCEVHHITHKEAQSVYSVYHYLGSCRGTEHFGAFFDGKLVGACSFGPFNRKEQSDKHGRNALELTRFCFDPQYQVKNFGSWFLSRCLKVVKRTVVTYADTTQGHDGALYKACNFKFSHDVAPDYYYVMPDGWAFHKQTIYHRASKMSVTEAEYVEKHQLQKKWGGKKLCFVFTQ